MGAPVGSDDGIHPAGMARLWQPHTVVLRQAAGDDMAGILVRYPEIVSHP